MKRGKKAGRIYEYNLKWKSSHPNFFQTDESDLISRQINVQFEKYGMKKFPKLSHEKCKEAIKNFSRFSDNDKVSNEFYSNLKK